MNAVSDFLKWKSRTPPILKSSNCILIFEWLNFLIHTKLTFVYGVRYTMRNSVWNMAVGLRSAIRLNKTFPRELINERSSHSSPMVPPYNFQHPSATVTRQPFGPENPFSIFNHCNEEYLCWNCMQTRRNLSLCAPERFLIKTISIICAMYAPQNKWRLGK